jgi:succinoglycan biosynthesis protein ExoM
MESAREIVSQFAAVAPIKLTYCVQPKQNISLTRNEALKQAKGDLIAFFDDDQFPIQEWLLTLYAALEEYEVDGVLGPVKPHFEKPPPKWVVAGKFCERATYETGFVIDWRKGRTGNVLFRRQILDGIDDPFCPEFLTGEDQDFFRRMIERGYVFIWCNEALAYETTPPIRWNIGFMLRRALQRGKVSIRHKGVRMALVGKSIIALPLYCLSLPFLPLFGYHVFVKQLVRIVDHTGRLLAFVGVNTGEENYVVE